MKIIHAQPIQFNFIKVSNDNNEKINKTFNRKKRQADPGSRVGGQHASTVSGGTERESKRQAERERERKRYRQIQIVTVIVIIVVLS